MKITNFSTGCKVSCSTGEFLIPVDDLEEGGFPLSVSANNSYSVALSDFEVLIVENRSLEPFKSLRRAIKLQHIHAGFIGGFEFEDQWLALLWNPCSKCLEFLLHSLDHLLLRRNRFVILVGALHLFKGASGCCNFLFHSVNHVAKGCFCGGLLAQELTVVALPRPSA